MMKRYLCAVLAAALLLPGCALRKECENMDVQKVTSDTLSVRKVENLPSDFILGLDASCVPALERGGVRYYDHAGQEKDVYRILAENGINYIRVRIWNDPYDEGGNGYGGGSCQVSSTLWDALMQLTGITVTMRKPHGNSGAAYLPHGMDASSGRDDLNLIFRNDYPFPVRIDASCHDHALFVAVYKGE